MGNAYPHRSCKFDNVQLQSGIIYLQSFPSANVQKEAPRATPVACIQKSTLLCPVVRSESLPGCVKMNVTLPPFNNRTNHMVFINLPQTHSRTGFAQDSRSFTRGKYLRLTTLLRRYAAQIWNASAYHTINECFRTDCSTIMSLFLVVL